MIQIDMEMPEKCGLCPLFHAEHPIHCQGVEADRKKKIVAPYGQPRPDWCPLHEVIADPDTVSRQAVIENVCTMLRNCFDASDEMIESVKITVGELPPSPSRPTAEKIQESYYSDKLVCSNCGIEARWDFEFCPYCGFKFKQTGGAV